jgi:hypothetical protein
MYRTSADVNPVRAESRYRDPRRWRMNPRAEAQQRAGDAYEARVLEPSPPTVTDGPWFADDPVARDGATRPVVSPVSSRAPTSCGDMSWASLAGGDADLDAWCRERWLGPYPALAAVPAELVATRDALHAVAEQVVAKARERANGKIGLRWVRGGFGTPFFGDDVQVSVEGTALRVVRRGEVSRTPLTSLAEAQLALGDLAPNPPAALDDAPLEIDAAAAGFVADWFGFATSVLEQLRARATPEHVPSRVQIWPEHFDAAVELGDERAGARAAYGCSPGDKTHPEPYIYVAPWTAPPSGELWDADGFAGAELPYADLRATADPAPWRWSSSKYASRPWPPDALGGAVEALASDCSR